MSYDWEEIGQVRARYRNAAPQSEHQDMQRLAAQCVTPAMYCAVPVSRGIGPYTNCLDWDHTFCGRGQQP